MSADVAVRKVAVDVEVPATGPLVHPVLLAMSVLLESYTPTTGFARAPDTLKAVSAGPMPRTRMFFVVPAGPETTNPAIRMLAPLSTSAREEMFARRCGGATPARAEIRLPTLGLPRPEHRSYPGPAL